jgi:hypothetical protein
MKIDNKAFLRKLAKKGEEKKECIMGKQAQNIELITDFSNYFYTVLANVAHLFITVSLRSAPFLLTTDMNNKTKQQCKQ